MDSEQPSKDSIPFCEQRKVASSMWLGAVAVILLSIVFIVISSVVIALILFENKFMGKIFSKILSMNLFISVRMQMCIFSFHNSYTGHTQLIKHFVKFFKTLPEHPISVLYSISGLWCFCLIMLLFSYCVMYFFRSQNCLYNKHIAWFSSMLHIYGINSDNLFYNPSNTRRRPEGPS